MRPLLPLLPLLLAAAIPTPALAAPKASPLPTGGEHNPPLVLSEVSTVVRALSQGASGYHLVSEVYISGAASKSDRARIDWRHKGKLIASAPCKLSISGGIAEGACNYREDDLKTKGDLEGQLIYWDDQQEREYLVRTFKVTMHQLKGRDVAWQIAADDVLGAAWMVHLGANDEDSRYLNRLRLSFWTATAKSLNGASLRCTVDGEKRFEDISFLDPQSRTGNIEADYLTKKGERQTYHWERRSENLDLRWGKREDLETYLQKQTQQDLFLGEHPGAWACRLRIDGKTVREFFFDVNKDGMVLTDEIQSAPDAIPTISKTISLIEMRIGKDAKTFDERIDPAAIKKSMGFGLPWPTHAKVKAMHKTLPPKSGLPDMK